jgi:hypothetical protein
MAAVHMELWTNDTFSEFGIKLNSQLVVETRETANLIKMIDETTFKDGYDHEWRYTLAQWIVSYLANKYLTSIESGQKGFQTVPDVNSDGNGTVEPFGSHRKRVKAGLKCHFCNLKYCLEEERRDHEQFWHNNKLSKILTH